MRKRKKGRKIGRKKAQREALLDSLARALILDEKIKTTEERAKELSPYIEKLITEAGEETLKAKKKIHSIFDEKAAKKMLNDIGPRFKKRSGGYTRVLKLGPRKSDGASMAIIELVSEE